MPRLLLGFPRLSHASAWAQTPTFSCDHTVAGGAYRPDHKVLIVAEQRYGSPILLISRPAPFATSLAWEVAHNLAGQPAPVPGPAVMRGRRRRQLATAPTIVPVCRATGRQMAARPNVPLRLQGAMERSIRGGHQHRRCEPWHRNGIPQSAAHDFIRLLQRPQCCSVRSPEPGD